MIIATYKITYQNGISQVKNLINHEAYIDKVRPCLELIDELKLTKNKKFIGIVKNYLKAEFGEHWFTNQSPLFEAIETGVIKSNYDWDSPVEVKLEKL